MSLPDPPLLARCSLLDLRSEIERAALPLPGAQVLSLAALEEGKGPPLAPQDGPYLVVCSRGPRAALAVRYLRSDGLDALAWPGSPAELRAALDAAIQTASDLSEG